jgi:hypothetical protein
MGAAAGKAVEDLVSSGGTTRAEDRLTVSERVIVQFKHRRMSSSGISRGIWDAQVTCTNRRLLAAVDEIIFLKETHVFPMASVAGHRMDRVLCAAMPHLMEKLLSLRI